MRLLVVSHDYAPLATPRAIRWTALCEHWAREGWSTEVVTRCVPGVEARESRNGVRVHRVGRLHALLAPAVAGGTSRAVVRAHGALWARWRWPDYAAAWVHPARRAAKRLLGQARDAVVSVSHPFSSHWAVAGLDLEVPWLADTGDPYALVPSVASAHRAHQKRSVEAEQWVLQRADAVCVPTKEMARSLLPWTRPERMHTIGPLVAPLTAAPVRVLPSTMGLKIVYAGSFYPTIRPAEPLLALFGALRTKDPEIELHLVGASPLPTDVVGLHRHGQKVPVWARAAMVEADVLVNVGNSTPHQLPSKLAEYVSLGKPILHLSAGPQDASTAFLDRYENKLVISQSAAQKAETDLVRDVIAFLRVARSSVPPAWVEEFGVERVAAGYETLLQKMLHRTSSS